MLYRDRCMQQLGRLLDMTKQLTDDQLIELGKQHLLEKELRDWAELRKAAIAEEKEWTRRIKAKLDELNEDGRIGSHSGGLNEVYLANLLDVDRMTVRGWLGKQRRKVTGAAEKGSTDAPVDPALLS